MRTKFLTMLALGAIIFASCESDNSQQENAKSVNFASGISSQTRVSGTDGTLWDGNESIGIYMVKWGETLSSGTILENADNVQYSTTSTGTSATFTAAASPIYYPVNLVSGNAQKVYFIASYPFTPTKIDNEFWYEIDVRDQSNQSAIDLMLAKSDNNGTGYDKDYESTVDLKFNHVLSKVIINVTAGTGVTNLTGLTVEMKGLDHKAYFDLKDQDLAGTGNVSGVTITPYSAGGNSFEVIIPPTDFTSLTDNQYVEFTVDGNTYKWIIKNNTTGDGGSISEFESGKKYTFEVELNKIAVNVVGTIEAWINGGTGEGVAE